MIESGLPGKKQPKFRLRIKFSRGNLFKFVANNDFIRFWERALRRADIPLEYSEGFSPHPKISICAPLPVGIISEAELMDIFLERYISPACFNSRIKSQLPADLEILEACFVPPQIPSLQSQIQAIEYEVKVKTDKSYDEINSVIAGFLSSGEIIWVQRREIGDISYDLRMLVNDIWQIGKEDPFARLGMRLVSGNQGTGRPEQVLKALGLDSEPEYIKRTRLIFLSPGAGGSQREGL